MDRVDSLAFDFQEWLYVEYEAGCVLVRDARAVEAAFTDGAAWSRIGPQLSRGFKSLKVWMSLQEHGVDRYAEAIARNVRQARHLAELVDDTPRPERQPPWS